MSPAASEPPPLPPADIAARSAVTVRLAAGGILHRFYTAAYDPIYFDKGRDGRLNAPDDSYGVLYAAAGPEGAFAEAFLRTPGRTQLPADLLARKAYVTLRVRRPLKLARLAGPGLARLGATAEVVHGGKPYDCPQAWSGALFAHPAGYDGSATSRRWRARPTWTRTGSGAWRSATGSASLRPEDGGALQLPPLAPNASRVYQPPPCGDDRMRRRAPCLPALCPLPGGV